MWTVFSIPLVSLLLLLTRAEAASIPITISKTCGYEACPTVDPQKLNIHIVAHTHDDVGWLKTVDQYYFGSRTTIQRAGVQYILDSVIKALLDNPERRFIYVETAFLRKWWLHQNENTKKDVRNLINEGRLEIIGGGWSMNDEAVTHYHSLVDQFTWGFRWLNDTFGSCARPHIGWQIDPFGHSREQASIFAQLGFDGMFLGRLDYQDKENRLENKTMEFIWKGSPSLGSRADLFTVALYNTYSPPPGFCFDVLCTDEPIIDDPNSPDYNVKERINAFMKYVVQQAEAYRTNNVILTMGGDFTYQHAEMYFVNLDKLMSERKGKILKLQGSLHTHRQNQIQLWLIRRSTTLNGVLYVCKRPNSVLRLVMIGEFLSYAQHQATSYQTNNVILTMGEDFNYQDAEMWFVNLDRLLRYAREHSSDVNIFYSTPSCYLKAVHDANLQWSTKADDFFPYASDPHSYWTGFFSSRPTIKFFERMGNNILQIVKQLSVLTDLKGYDKELEYFREAMGIMQHHDAVTGTEKQLVASDYARILHNGMQQGKDIITEAISKWGLSESQGLTQLKDMNSCLQLNISSCPYTENTNFLLTVYNPLSFEIRTPIRIPIEKGTYSVEDLADGGNTISQLVPIPDSVLKIPGRISNASHELVFIALVPPLGYKSYKVVQKSRDAHYVVNEASFIENEYNSVSISNESQIIVEWKKENNMSLVQSFHYYEGVAGNNKVFKNRSSGAYIFRPKTVSTKDFMAYGSYKIYIGPVVQEIHLTINDWVSQVIRLYKKKEYIEFDWLIGPIPVKDNIGKEIVTKYSSNLNSNGEFYTDTNGREMLKRKRNYRPTWNLKLEEKVSGNYYPVASKISLKDEERFFKLSVLTDRTEGGTSMKDGEIELMLHRRLLKDDAFGVGEALNETAYGEGLVVRGSHYVLGGSITNLDKFVMKEKSLALETSLRPWILFTPLTPNSTIENYSSTWKKSGLAKTLPPNVHILTLEPWKDGTVLLRLEHIFEVGETEKLSKPVEINIQDLFSTFKILSVKETTLGGNQWIQNMNRLKWESETNDVLRAKENIIHPIKLEDGVMNVLLKPMEIRTFIVETAPKNV